VINSYSLQSQVDVGGQIAPVGRGDTFGALGVTGRYADQPTITYSPLSGDKFAKNLMTPLPITGVLLLIQGGYAPDFVFRICVSAINGLENSYGGFNSSRFGSGKFQELLSALREAQTLGGAGLRIRSSKDNPAVVMFVQPSADAAINVPIARIREL